MMQGDGSADAPWVLDTPHVKGCQESPIILDSPLGEIGGRRGGPAVSPQGEGGAAPGGEGGPAVSVRGEGGAAVSPGGEGPAVSMRGEGCLPGSNEVLVGPPKKRAKGERYKERTGKYTLKHGFTPLDVTKIDSEGRKLSANDYPLPFLERGGWTPIQDPRHTKRYGGRESENEYLHTYESPQGEGGASGSAAEGGAAGSAGAEGGAAGGEGSIADLQKELDLWQRFLGK